VESGIHGHGIRNLQRGIRNPGLSWITLHGANINLVAKEMLSKLEAEVIRLATPRLLSLDRGSEVEDIHEIAILLPD